VAARGLAPGNPTTNYYCSLPHLEMNPKSESSSGTDNPTNRLLSWRLSRHYRFREDLVADWLGEGLFSPAMTTGRHVFGRPGAEPLVRDPRCEA
jgi:hypothetical protein